MESSNPQFQIPWKLIAVLFLITVGVHLRAIANDFVSYNDWVYIVFNPDVNPVTAQTFAHLWSGPRLGLFQPMDGTLGALIALAAHMPSPDPTITASGGQLDPRVYHFASVFVHGIDTVLVFLLLRRFVSSGLACFVGALLFGIHPMQVENIAWASASDRLLCLLFSIPALLLYVHKPAQPKNPVSAAAPYLGAIFLGVLAVLCKPTAIVLPVIALVMDRALLNRTWRQSLLAYAPWQLTVMPILLASSGAVDPSDRPLTMPLWTRPIVAADSIAFNIAKFVFPANLSLDYGRTPQFVMHHWWAFATWILPVAAAALIWRFTGPRDPMRTGFLMFVIALIPTIGLVPFPSQSVSTVADRYIYPAMPGLSLIAAALVARLVAIPQLKTPAFAAAGVWLTVLAVLTLARIPVWSNGLTLMAATLRENPVSYNALTYLGKEYELRGQIDRAYPFFVASRGIRPTFYQPYYNLGTVYFARGDVQSAIGEFQTAIRYAPLHTESDIALGNCYVAEHRLDMAKNAYLAAVERQPDDPDACYDLGNIAAVTKDYGTAEEYFADAIRLSPHDAMAHAHLAQVMARRGEAAAAQSEAQTAHDLARNPTEHDQVNRILSE